MLIGDHAQARELLEQGMQQAAEQGYKPAERVPSRAAVIRSAAPAL
jgi:hypothetical protein